MLAVIFAVAGTCADVAVACGRAGTAGLNVPMFIALRRFTLIFTIVLDYALFRKTYDAITISSVSVMVGGAPLVLSPCCFSRHALVASSQGNDGVVGAVDRPACQVEYLQRKGHGSGRPQAGRCTDTRSEGGAEVRKDGRKLRRWQGERTRGRR